MAYSDFGVRELTSKLNLIVTRDRLFPDTLEPLQPPEWLEEFFRHTAQHSRLTEKARSELVVMPVLAAATELAGLPLTVYSGQRLDVDDKRGLMGECDFLVSRGEALPTVTAPLITVVEAKRNDLEAGLYQCLAQMVGIQVFNAQAESVIPTLYGCVTNAQVWQFLRLEGNRAAIDTREYYRVEIGTILRAFTMIAAASLNPTSASHN